MAGLCWMAVVLVFSLTVGNTEAMDQNKVQTIAKYILDTYSEKYSSGTIKQFSLAANIPVNQDLKKLQDLFNADVATTVKDELKKKKVYTSANIVAALPLKEREDDVHAEPQVLANIDPLIRSSAGKSLVFYSYLSPCGAKCTNRDHPNNILDPFNNKIPTGQWAERAFVFSSVYSWYRDQNGLRKNFTLDEIRAALKELGGTKFGRDNIFRCNYLNNGPFQCIKCFINAEPDRRCVENSA